MEKAYFPMNTLNISQGYGTDSYSHKYNMAIDVTGANAGIEVAYAPFTGVVKKIYAQDANEMWFESKDEVLCADGVSRKLVVLVAHANNVPVSVGQEIKQGDIFYQEGTKGNVTGNHMHIEVGVGPFNGSGWFKNSHGVWQINNPLAPEKIFWLKQDTKVENTVYQGRDYLMRTDEELPNPLPTPDDTLNVGDKVKIIGPYASSSSSVSAVNKRLIGEIRYITKIYNGANFPYQIGNQGKTNSANTTGFAKATSLEKL